MSTIDEHGARGKMELYYRNEESASSHRDQRRHLTLKALDEKTMQLSIEVSDSNAYKGTVDTYGTKHYKISVNDLIKLIKENGTEFYPRRVMPPAISPQRPTPKKAVKKSVKKSAKKSPPK